MSDGVDPRLLLARRTTPLTVYFRDDDAGWDNAALMRLLGTFARRQVPIDLALIPDALDTKLASALRQAAVRQPLGIHQHGFRHLNHEPGGRKCEFGPSRGASAQTADITAGAQMLRQALGGLTQPIFTPPWNRCTQATVTALVDAGLRALSRDCGAAALDTPGLQSLPINLDWQKRPRAGLAFETALAQEGAVGIMLHHAVMDDHDHEELEVLLDRLHASACVRFVCMGELLTHGE